MRVEPIVVSPYDENTYLVWNEETKRGFIVDPGDEAPRLISGIKRNGITLEAILLTHGHADHIGAVAEIKQEFKIPIYIGEGEEELLLDPAKNLSVTHGGSVIAPPADHLLNEGDKITIADFELEIISTPGHSPASICYLHEKIMFCGDVVFMGSIGRTDLPGANHEVMMNTLREKILPLSDEIFLYSGHGPATTVGRERIANPFLNSLSPVS